MTLKDNESPPENYRRLILDAVCTGPNARFNAFVQHIIDDAESGVGSHATITMDALIIACKTKYNNMDGRNKWTAVDPRDAWRNKRRSCRNLLPLLLQPRSPMVATATMATLLALTQSSSKV